MCLCNSESINHVFLHCTVATGLWNMFFSLFGLTWVMPRSLREAFVCWSSWEVGKSIKHIWSLVPALFCGAYGQSGTKDVLMAPQLPSLPF
ncbi:hypothetical protein MTR67_005037 [Solanum verrucosum]|uniref:Reverse transcriptase zinc-binding domain-containing protein n=1 Tax=Solanum verrucosum TaxID=315347 RepID=A0AAF0PVK4_SOLVR|nr:hypothetical protein MTR67_005037 [Solanum verrucosum]